MNVIGIKFKDGGKIYYFSPEEGAEYAENMEVIVETGRGLEFAFVAFPPREVEDAEVTQPLRPVVRIATEKDREQRKKNLERRSEAIRTAQEKANGYGLAMKIIDCEFTFDGNKVLFFFSAENRVDFRELVRDLAGTFHSRIELRQVGARDEARLLGGIAPCGRECCCAGAMPDFCKVSIKMAKVQGLSLNPGKISGLCGRLMCCLSYENEYYSEAYKKMPKLGGEVATPEGKGTVVSNNMLTYTVRVKIEKDGGLVYKDFPLADIRFRSKGAPAEEESAQDEADELPPEEGAEGQRNTPRRQGERRKNEKPRTDKSRRQERPAQRAEELPPREGGQPQAEGQERRPRRKHKRGHGKKGGNGGNGGNAPAPQPGGAE